MCKCIIRQCEVCGDRGTPKVKLCDVGKAGYIHVKRSIHTSSPLLRVGTNMVDQKKEIDMALLMEEEIHLITCSSCASTRSRSGR